MAGKALRLTPVLEGLSLVTPEIVTKAHDIVMGDRRVTGRYIASAVGASQERVHSIPMEDLDMRKVCQGL